KGARPHGELARRYNHHLGTVARALPERILGLERLLGAGAQHIWLNLSSHIRSYGRELTPKLPQVGFIHPTHEARQKANRQHADPGLRSQPSPPRCLPALLEKLAVDSRDVLGSFSGPAQRLSECQTHEQRIALRTLGCRLPRATRGFESASPGQELALR